MNYLATIKNIRSGEYVRLFLFSPIAIGDIIGWGADEQNADGIAPWKVIDCIATS